MSNYTTSWDIRYNVPHLTKQVETAVVTAGYDTANEDPGTPDHANRVNWANWAVANSALAARPFGWPVAKNPSIVSSVAADPSGESVADNDVQFVVNSVLQDVVDEWVAHPPSSDARR